MMWVWTAWRSSASPVSTGCSQKGCSQSDIGSPPQMPLTRTSSRPSCRAASSPTSAATAAGSAWSTRWAYAVPPSAAISSAGSSTVSGRAIGEGAPRAERPVTCTVAPARPSSTAIARVAPRVPPATSATRPASGRSTSESFTIWSLAPATDSAPGMASLARVLILLPPSEGKAEPRRGKPLDLTTGPLAEARRTVVDALVDLCRGPQDVAIATLGLGPTQADDVRRNARLRDLPTAPAERVYSGVLYDALGLTSLDASAHRRALGRVAIISSLYGVVRPGERIAPYRLGGGGTLPRPGGGAAPPRPPPHPGVGGGAGGGGGG